MYKKVTAYFGKKQRVKQSVEHKVILGSQDVGITFSKM